ncbi:SHOCT domain-containing protein [Butyricicoccus porcorum]|uniref:SHOCT domain-containing protein n=1 Tax=Butyricicoccus porcorum TaxID=1945634 RepID=UPI003F4AC747
MPVCSACGKRTIFPMTIKDKVYCQKCFQSLGVKGMISTCKNDNKSSDEIHAQITENASDRIVASNAAAEIKRKLKSTGVDMGPFSGMKVGPLSGGSIKAVASMVRNDETIIGALDTFASIGEPSGRFKGKSFTHKGRDTGVVVITDKRVLFASREAGLSSSISMNLSDINSITDTNNTGFSLHAGLNLLETKMLISTSSTSLAIYNTNAFLKPFKKVLIEAMGNVQAYKQADTVVIKESFSAADEIEKFKQLLDQGIITEEEFDAKKKQLLGL